MDDVKNIIRNTVLSKNPSAELRYILEENDPGVKIEIVDNVAVFHIRYKCSMKARRLADYSDGVVLKAVQAAFPETTAIRIDYTDTAFTEEIAEEEKQRKIREKQEAIRLNKLHVEMLVASSNMPKNTRLTHTFAKFQVIDGNREAYRLAREFCFNAIGDEDDSYDNRRSRNG